MSMQKIDWGIRDKTFWNWMELLIVPLILAAGAMYLDMSQTAKQDELETSRIEEARRIEDERHKVGILNDYRGVITELVKDNGLLSGTPDNGAVEAAKSITDATLSQLDGPQKGALLSFLFHSKLIGHPERPNAVISLFNSDFRGAALTNANLSSAILNDTDLSGADLTGALLWGTQFNEFTVLAGADFSGVVLRFAGGLTCEQLQQTKNWDSAIRDERLSCGRPIPEEKGEIVEEEPN
jgi:hypothetical protein